MVGYLISLLQELLGIVLSNYCLHDFVNHRGQYNLVIIFSKVPVNSLKLLCVRLVKNSKLYIYLLQVM